MQDALESIFGPGVGLIGFFVMFIMLWPKIRNYWRGYRARKKGPVDCRDRILGQRGLRIAPSEFAKAELDHPEHGSPLEVMTPNFLSILLESFVWLFPLIATLIWVPAGYYSLRVLCLVVSGFMALLGIISLTHLGDRVVFYKTGMILRLRCKKRSIDYNSILSFTERNSLIPWLPSGMIIHLDDGKILVLEGTYLKRGRRLRAIFHALPERISGNAASEKLIHS